MKRLNIAGLRFGKLVVSSFAGIVKGTSRWFAVCDCGNLVTVMGKCLISGHTKSCGCYSKENNPNFKHGHARCGRKTPEWRAYVDAKRRCSKTNRKDYSYYGGRGIQFRFNDFSEFLSELGPKPTPQHSIDRIDVNGHYEKGNVRWATKREQRLNQRSSRQEHV